MRKTVHIVGCGGPAGVGLTRCLRDHYEVTGEDSGRWSPLMAECPAATGLFDLLVPVPDRAVLEWLESLGEDSPRLFLPSLEQVRLCQDKAATASLLGELAPKTYWLRDARGSGGSGAKMLSNYLPGKNYSVEFAYLEGKLISRFQKERLSYSPVRRTAGIENRGTSAVSVCSDDSAVWEAAQEAIRLLPGVPNGFYGIDFKLDEHGDPKVTEINAGRLLTASYAFFSGTGYNLPLAALKAFFGEESPVLPAYPAGWGQVRQEGQEPRLFGPDETKGWDR